LAAFVRSASGFAGLAVCRLTSPALLPIFKSMNRRPWLGVFALVLALVQSVGPAHCAWSFDGMASCDSFERGSPGAAADAPSEHACCANAETADVTPKPAADDAGCTCPCMTGAAVPTVALLGGPPLGRELPAEAAILAIAPVALELRSAIVPTNEHAPPGADPRLHSSRGPPALA
jgi:hypothetical protein